MQLSHKELLSAWCESSPCVRGCAVLFSLAEQRIRLRLGFLRAGGRGGSKQRCLSNAKGTVLTSGFPSAASCHLFSYHRLLPCSTDSPCPNLPPNHSAFWDKPRGRATADQKLGPRGAPAAGTAGRRRVGGDAGRGATLGGALRIALRSPAGQPGAAARPPIPGSGVPRSPAPPPGAARAPRRRRRRAARLRRRSRATPSAAAAASLGAPTHAALPPPQPTPPGLKVTSARSRSHFGRATEQHHLSPLREGPGPSGAGLPLAAAERSGKGRKAAARPLHRPPRRGRPRGPGARGRAAAAAGARRAAVRAGKGCGGGGGEPRPAATCPACPLPSDGRGAASFGRRPPLYGEFSRGREGGGGGGASRCGGWRDGGGAPAAAGKFPGPPGGCGAGGGGAGGGEPLRALRCAAGAGLRLGSAKRSGRGDGQSGTAETREIVRKDEENGQAGVSRVTG